MHDIPKYCIGYNSFFAFFYRRYFLSANCRKWDVNASSEETLYRLFYYEFLSVSDVYSFGQVACICNTYAT